MNRLIWKVLYKNYLKCNIKITVYRKCKHTLKFIKHPNKIWTNIYIYISRLTPASPHKNNNTTLHSDANILNQRIISAPFDVTLHLSLTADWPESQIHKEYYIYGIYTILGLRIQCFTIRTLLLTRKPFRY